MNEHSHLGDRHVESYAIWNVFKYSSQSVQSCILFYTCILFSKFISVLQDDKCCLLKEVRLYHSPLLLRKRMTFLSSTLLFDKTLFFLIL